MSGMTGFDIDKYNLEKEKVRLLGRLVHELSRFNDNLESVTLSHTPLREKKGHEYENGV